MTYYHVKLLNDSRDKSTARIVSRNTPYGVFFNVFSENLRMKSHIESVLSTIAYIGAPGRNTANFFADAALELPYNSIYFEAAIFEILGWRGYNVTLETMVNKSADFDEIIHGLEEQILGHPDLTHNSFGHRALIKVPIGKIVVSKDGKVLSGGNHFNLDIDSDEGDNWHILDNPYEKIGPEKRNKLLQYMNVGLDKYHPGAEESSYRRRLSDSDPYGILDRSYTPDGPSVREYYSVSSPNRSVGSLHNLPKKLDPGGIVYSPQTGQAFDSKFWPMEGLDYDLYDWYLFRGTLLSDEERDLYHPITGLTPDMIPGVSSGLVQSERGLDVSSGFLINKKRDEDHSGYSVIPEKIPSPSYTFEEMSTPEWANMYNKYKDSVAEILSIENFSSVKINDLRGFAASFSSHIFDYQKPFILSLSMEGGYDAFGGPKGWSGKYINVRSGVSKISSLAAAVSVMRNRDFIKNGVQTVVIICPNKSSRVWQSELGRLMGEHAVIIDGADDSRIDQWAKVMDKADSDELPRFIIVTPSNFMVTRPDYEDSDQGVSEMRIDYDHLRLLSVGGKHGKTYIKGNRVSVLGVDEVSEYTRPGSTRNKFLRSLSDNIYYGKGVTWLFNGDFSPKSAGEIISSICFVNKYARDNYEMMINEYTEPDVSEGFRRYWKSFDHMNDFYRKFSDQIYSESTNNNLGDYGLVRQEDEFTPIGNDWYSIYFLAEKKINSILNSPLENRLPGVASILIDAGMGSVTPRRLLEYDLDSKKLMDLFRYHINDDSRSIEAFSQIDRYLSVATESFSDHGRFPKQGLSDEERKSMYDRIVSYDYRDLLDSVVANWPCPYSESIVSSIKNDFIQCMPSGRNKKIGVLGFSGFFLEKIEMMLKDLYQDSGRVLIQVINSNTTPEDAESIAKNHINERLRNVVTLVSTGYRDGLFIPSDKIYRVPSGNPSRGHQYESIFHRSDNQSSMVSVVVPDGVARYLRDMENRKGLMSYAYSSILDVDDSGDELKIKSLSLRRFVDKMRHYRPRVMYI